VVTQFRSADPEEKPQLMPVLERLTAEERSRIGQKAGLIGSKARATRLSRKRRSAIAGQAAMAQWAKTRGEAKMK